jgi:anti-anti-sigma regulatory factor
VPNGEIAFQERGGTLDIRVRGPGTLDASVPLRRLIERHLARGAGDVRMRLDECTYMDSTFVGTIVFVLRAARERRDVSLTIAAPSEPCREILRALRLDALLTIVDAAPPPQGEWTPLEGGARDTAAFRSTVMCAHVELAALPGEAGAAFEAVAREMTAERRPGPSPATPESAAAPLPAAEPSADVPSATAPPLPRGARGTG